MVSENSYIGKQIVNYRIVAELGSGTFGGVYQAKHIIFPERPYVAIKLLHARFNSQQNHNQFFEEAKVLERLVHPHILPVIDAGFYEGCPYIVAEYESNGSLRDLIQRQSPQPLSIEDALSILSQLGQALQHAHEQNIVHCDLTPENILFNAKGDVLLADFGIAVTLETAGTQYVDRRGTLSYMAPEQFEGNISMKSDQYALGIIAYELFTGRRPFIVPHPSWEAMWYQHAKVNPIPPTQLNSQIPIHIEKAILKAMAKERTQRHSNISTFITALHSSSLQEEIAAIVSIDVPTVPSFQVQKTREQGLEEGDAHYNDKCFAEALAAYERAIQLDPNYAPAYNSKGNVLRRLKRYTEAIAVHEQGIQLDSDYAPAYSSKGHVLRKLK